MARGLSRAPLRRYNARLQKACVEAHLASRDRKIAGTFERRRDPARESRATPALTRELTFAARGKGLMHLLAIETSGPLGGIALLATEGDG
ncbi:MAG: hypothetical protein U9R68_05730, partial [Planctomycetota bacterium]|nr:hypothetical protein [Planctomycetota bacterium]